MARALRSESIERPLAVPYAPVDALPLSRGAAVMGGGGRAAVPLDVREWGLWPPGVERGRM
jgi:hypothetical protein